MDINTRINGKAPVDIRINNKPILAIMINGARVWPIEKDPEPENPVDVNVLAVLSCFGMGCWVDDFTWNDNAIWSD